MGALCLKVVCLASYGSQVEGCESKTSEVLDNSKRLWVVMLHRSLLVCLAKGYCSAPPNVARHCRSCQPCPAATESMPQKHSTERSAELNATRRSKLQVFVRITQSGLKDP
ncbi:predicted protein [Coccidioides posadasii str. Silveira]|uniref:Predicted protein n=1 Tax=Coccidioides posadasii (strain RMSCC 757 / Silveira) TaxID=443226 RepID=E9DCE7_COCPS|nr:predicted protein [Coccidioides posadasii str. Silveira]